MTDYTTEQRKADAETLRTIRDRLPLSETGKALTAIADRLDPAPPPMTLREAVAKALRSDQHSTFTDAVLAVVADPAHRAEVLVLLGDPAPQTYDADNPPPVGSLVVWRDRSGLPFAAYPRTPKAES